jgi:hypothetical protein
MTAERCAVSLRRQAVRRVRRVRRERGGGLVAPAVSQSQTFSGSFVERGGDGLVDQVDHPLEAPVLGAHEFVARDGIPPRIRQLESC